MAYSTILGTLEPGRRGSDVGSIRTYLARLLSMRSASLSIDWRSETASKSFSSDSLVVSNSLRFDLSEYHLMALPLAHHPKFLLTQDPYFLNFLE